MKKPILLLFAILGTYFCALSQVQLSLSSPMVSSGDIFKINVLVDGFNSMTSCQFALQWDPQVIQFQQISDIAVDASVADNFNLLNAANGYITFGWSTNEFAGINIATGGTLFSVQFLAVGNNGTSTPLSFTTLPNDGPIESYDVNGELSTNVTNGLIMVGPNAISDIISNPSFSVKSPMPNPMTTQSNFLLEMSTAEAVTLEIFDFQGKLVYKESRDLPQGTNNWLVQSTSLKSAGNYAVRVSTKAYNATHKLMYSGN